MADHLQFEDRKPMARPDCRRCEELLADAVDDDGSSTLAADDQVFFDRHVSTCADCMAAQADARRGAAWLEMLRTPRPEPSAQLLERILLATSGEAGADYGGMPGELEYPGFEVLPSGLPSWVAQPAMPGYPTRVLPFRPRKPQSAPGWLGLSGLNRLLFEPRLAMTAAMAFFSIALTLNLAGVRLNELHARDLGPAGLRRSYYEATASATRRYEGLRVVHTMESRLNDLNNLRESGPDADSRPDSPVPESRRDLPTAPTPTQPAAGPDAAPAESKPGKPASPGGGVSLRMQPPAGPGALPVVDRKLTPVLLTKFSPIHKEGGLA